MKILWFVTHLDGYRIKYRHPQNITNHDGLFLQTYPTFKKRQPAFDLSAGKWHNYNRTGKRLRVAAFADRR
jgi:hypothetical protein